MIHLDTSNKAREITPLCGGHSPGDSFIFVDLANRDDLKESSEFVDCLTCKGLALANSSGKVGKGDR